MATISFKIKSISHFIDVQKMSTGIVTFSSNPLLFGGVNLISQPNILNNEQKSQLIYGIFGKNTVAIEEVLVELQGTGHVESGEITEIEFSIWSKGEEMEIFFAFYESDIRLGIIRLYQNQNTNENSHYQIFSNGKEKSHTTTGAWFYSKDAEVPVYSYTLEGTTISEILSNSANLDKNGEFDAYVFVDSIWNNIVMGIENLINEYANEKSN